jgi:DNA mismatch repair protein MutL
MLQAGTSPDYFIYFDINPENIDVNIHPTKTEIKFENEQAIFPVILTSVKEALGRFNVMPSIDFDQEGSPDIPVFNTSEVPVQPPKININPEYNPFKTQDKPSYTRPKMDDWSKLYEGFENDKNQFVSQTEETIELFSRISDEDTDDTCDEDISFSIKMEDEENAVNYFQLKNKYILTSVKSGLMCIDQHRAHVRILFDRFLSNLTEKQTFSQKLLFPERLDLLSSEALILDEIKDDLLYLGFEISDLGNHSYAINSMPAMHSGQEAKPFVLNMIDAVKDHNTNIKAEMLENVALSLAKMSAISSGKPLLQDEMIGLINELFACSDHYFTPDNKPIIVIIAHEEVDRLFK